VPPVLEQAALARIEDQPVKVGGVVLPEPAPQHEVLAARDAVQRVDLHAANLLDHLVDRLQRGCWLAAGRGCKALHVERHRAERVERVGCFPAG